MLKRPLWQTFRRSFLKRKQTFQIWKKFSIIPIQIKALSREYQRLYCWDQNQINLIFFNHISNTSFTIIVREPPAVTPSPTLTSCGWLCTQTQSTATSAHKTNLHTRRGSMAAKRVEVKMLALTTFFTRVTQCSSGCVGVFHSASMPCSFFIFFAHVCVLNSAAALISGKVCCFLCIVLILQRSRWSFLRNDPLCTHL